jgi:anti-sigma B factor antagonist
MYWKLATRKVDDVGIIDVLKIDFLSQDRGELKCALVEHLAKGKRKILIHLGNERYMDSSGVGELFECYQVAMGFSAKFALLGVHKKIYDLLVMAKLNQIFEVFSDEAEALKSFS